MQRSYSLLTVKTVQEDARTIRGIATTPTPDRVGDVVEPLGVKYKNPLPLLWQHHAAEPVGTVKLDKPTANGIDFEAQFPKDLEPGTLKDRIDEAWQSVKLGLVRGVSIGFRPIEYAFMDSGVRFIESEVLELSLVTIPANVEATIQQVKAFDVLNKHIPAPVSPGDAGKGSDRPGDAGIPSKPIVLASKDAPKMKTINEQIEAWSGRRAADDAAMKAIQAKCTDENRSKDEKERDEYDRLRDSVNKIDLELRDLREAEEINKRQAIVVSEIDTAAKAVQARSPGNGATPYGVVQVKANVPPATGFVRYCQAVARSAIERRPAWDIAKEQLHWHNTPEVAMCLSPEYRTKAAVGAGTTTDATWASPLVVPQILASEFIPLLRAQTIIGRIPGLHQVPFNIKIPRETSPTAVNWVGENAPKPVTSAAFDSVTLLWAKAAGIVLLTQELVRFSNPSAEALIRDDLVKSMTAFLDRQFIDPAVAAVANVSPASITNGVTPATASGTTAASWRIDAGNMLKSMVIQNLSLASGVWIMTQQQATTFSLMVTSLGVPLYPGMTAAGGTLLGYPVIASENIPSTGGSPADGYPIIFAIASEILYADDGQTLIDASQEASVQMDTTPDSPPTASSNMVSLWQMNYVGLRAERWINWLKRRNNVVGYIQNAKYQE